MNPPPRADVIHLPGKPKPKDPLPPLREPDPYDWSGFWAFWIALTALVALFNWAFFWR